MKVMDLSRDNSALNTMLRDQKKDLEAARVKEEGLSLRIRELEEQLAASSAADAMTNGKVKWPLATNV